MKQRIRLTESDLHRIVKESVKRVLNEESPYDNDGRFYDVIDRSLSQNTDGNAYVSRFYSGPNQITIAVYVTNDIRNTKRAVIETMKKFYYEYYTSGANGKYVMMTFKQNGNEVTESMGKKVTKGKSYWGETNKRQNYNPYYDDEMRINYTGGRPGVMWDADETPLKYKQSKFQ